MTSPEPSEIFLKLPSTDFETKIQLLSSSSQAYFANLNGISLATDTIQMLYTNNEFLSEEDYYSKYQKHYDAPEIIYLSMILSADKVRQFKCLQFGDTLILKKYED